MTASNWVKAGHMAIAGNTERSDIGAVMVIGGGIAGIQASLDLAESGYKVYLLEKGPAIGGVMAQLDKTFPTNDCSMCILSPKLVAAGRHPDIELLTNTDVNEVFGHAGNFLVRALTRARSVDVSKCTGCGNCVTACPVKNRVRMPEPDALDEDEATQEDQQVDAIIAAYGGGRESLIQVLQDVNTRFRYLPEFALRRISWRLGVPYAEVYGTASFYRSFSLEPRGQHIIQVCMGTACHVRGAPRILDELERRLDIGAGQTTADRVFTLERVNCLGACALAPVIAIDGDFHGRLGPGQIPKLLDACRGKVAAAV